MTLLLIMLLSFIIPVYNVEKYLAICIDSILNQGLDTRDYEIILVEDKSTDNSLQICRDYCSCHENITLIENVKNLGQGMSRNKGMMESKGDYLHFVDSDDFLYQKSIQNLLSLGIFSSEPDVVRFESNIQTTCPNYQNKIEYAGRFDDASTLEPCLCVWRYWFKRAFLLEHGIWSQNKITGQDAIFTMSVFSHNPYIISTSTIVYFYRNNTCSISLNKDIRYVECLYEVAAEINSIATGAELSSSYLNEVLKDTINRFYRTRRTYKECLRFKRNIKIYKQYDSLIIRGRWYNQLARIPLLLYLYLTIKKG